MADDLLTLFHQFDAVLPPMNANVTNLFDNYDDKTFYEHFWPLKTLVKCLIDEIITIQLHQRL